MHIFLSYFFFHSLGGWLCVSHFRVSNAKTSNNFLVFGSCREREKESKAPKRKSKRQVIIGMACKCDDVSNVFGIKPISKHVGHVRNLPADKNNTGFMQFRFESVFLSSFFAVLLI